MRSAPAHSEIHTHNYETWVGGSINDAANETMLSKHRTNHRLLRLVVVA